MLNRRKRQCAWCGKAERRFTPVVVNKVLVEDLRAKGVPVSHSPYLHPKCVVTILEKVWD